LHNCHRTTYSSHIGLRQNSGRSTPKRRQMWRISSKATLKCTHTMWKNERQAGETTG
jgi:hypothetical protein